MATITMTAPAVTSDVAEAGRSGVVDPSVPVGLRPDSEVVEKPARRRFPAKEKLRILREAGALAALAPRKRGRPARVPPWTRRVAELECQNARLQRRLQQAEAIIEIQKKVSARLGIPLNHPGSGESA